MKAAPQGATASRRRVYPRWRDALAPWLAAFAILLSRSFAADTLKFSPEQKGLASVIDPAASDKKAVAVNLSTESGSVLLGALKSPLAPGLYQFAPRLRLLLPADYDRSRLKLTLSFLVEGKPVAQMPLIWPLFNERAGAYTEFDQPLSFTKTAALSVELSWSIAPVPVGEKPRAIVPQKGPNIEETSKRPGKKGADPLDELVSGLQADVAVPLSSITYPAVLADQVAITPATSTLATEKVWPGKVHVYPGEPNPIEVTVRNYTPRLAQATVRLEIRTGLDQSSPPMEATVDVPANGTASHRFDWTAGETSFGHEARATVSVAGAAVHAASEYFTVGAPIWKTAIQGSGFITWFGRESDFPEHVASNRRKYINVEEAFSWQPSSWTDLNPTADQWWTGQNNFHNSLKGLRQWMGLSHREGIKMITYSWPSASGPAGIEWGRRHPELVTHVAVGLASEFHDVEDLKLSDLLHTNPAFQRLQYGVWHGFGINLGWLKTVDLGAEEIVKSAKNFGWDGVRFDSPPGWSAMGAADMHAEMEQMGLAEKVASLVPETCAVQTGEWSGEAISIRNVRWLRHRFQTEIGPHFAMSYNYGINVEADGRRKPDAFFQECCRDGGQVMHEAIRQSSSWEAYRKTALQQAEIARQDGGFHTLFAPDKAPAWSRTFAAIFTFAAGSHPYGDYGWGPTMAGTYSQFMTRYGEFCWDLALAPVSAEKADVTVKSEAALLWREYLKQKSYPDGSLTVMHLISPPPVDPVVPLGKIGTLTPWQKDVVVTKKCAEKPVVWMLSAEPVTHAEQLPVQASGDAFAVTVPEHHYWTMLVWQEGGR